MSSRTPSRISLRRKRLCNEFESNEPSPKRISPAKNDQLVSDQKKNEKKEIIETDKSLIATNMMTPKNYKKRGVKRNFQTPKTPRNIESDTSLCNKNEATENEFSPSQSPSQFPSSQIPSTQDWEVVWDCNSPGYSKEELKKMGDDHSDKSFNSSPIASFPNRLFTKLKRRPLPLSPIHLPSRLNSKNSMAVAAELDSLLIKVNGERIQQLEEQSDDSEPLANDISNILNASSQPFDVSNLEEETLNHSVQNPKEKLEKDSVPHHEASVPLVKNSVKEKNSETKVDFLSFDDDDLFSESFLLSSQALEESMLKKEPETQKSNFTTNKSFSPLSRIRKKPPTVIDDSKEVKFVKSDNESTTSPIKTKSLSSYKIGPDTLCQIPSKVSNTNKLDVSSGVADSISDNFCQNKAKTNLQNDFDASDLLNTKTNGKNFVKVSSFKTNKPRATFQLNIPSSQSLHKLFTSKFSSSENRTSSCNKNEIDTSDNTRVINASSSEKYNRSKSESSHLSTNVTKIKSCSSLIESNFGANVTQELDDDDEIFASLMPALIEVEAEHVKKLSQELKVNNEVSIATASCIQSSVNSFPTPSVSDQISFSFNNIQNQSSQLKPCDMQTKSIIGRDGSSIQNNDKSLCVDRFSKINKPSTSEKRAGISEVVAESCLTNQKSSSSLDWKDQKFKTENKRSENLSAFAGN
ncbi:UNVERIFIED_CONTAM: hypothetical protein RMT77_019357 [Armadillidium vulgare]